MFVMQPNWTLIALIWITAISSVGSAVAQKWQVKGLDIEQHDNALILSIDSASFDSEAFKSIDYQCPAAVPIYPQHSCEGAQLSVDWQNHQWQGNLDSRFDFQSDSGQLSAQLFDRQLTLDLPLDQSVLGLKLDELALNTLSPWLPSGLTDAVTGLFNGAAEFDLNRMTLTASGLDFNGIEGGYGDDVFVSQLSGQLAVAADLSHLQFEVDFSVQKGEALLGPVYLNFEQFPLKLHTTIVLNGIDGWLVQTEIKQAETMQGNLTVAFSEQGEVTSAKADMNVLDAKPFNQHVLSSVLDLYGFKQSDMEGQFRLSMDYDGEKISQSQLGFSDFYFENALSKLSAVALQGQVNWHHSQVQTSELQWDALLLAGMPVGQSDVSFEFYKDEFRILGQPEWPVFDGTIALQEWHISQLFSEFVDMEISAEIMPISLALVTEKMGWPLMTGSLSGKIPAVIKKGPVIELKGGLDLNVFEGKMRVNQLSTERLFGVAPVIAGDVAFDQLNLGQLTDTFDFGRITGLLSGSVDELRITNWKADRLKAEIYTVEQKGIKQTISQQAIDHISSIGGIQGALSRTFLRFFDDFKYKKSNSAVYYKIQFAK